MNLNYQSSYENLLKKANLVLFNYDSTGFLENLRHNIPSICIIPKYNKNINHLAFEDYKKLIDTNIFFRNYDDATLHINNKWSNIDEWWNEAKCQKCIKLFTEKYSSKFTLRKFYNLANEFKN